MRSSLSLLALLALASSTAFAASNDLVGKDPHARPDQLSVSKSACAQGTGNSNTICPVELLVLTNDASQYRFIVAAKTPRGGQPNPEDYGTDRGYRITAAQSYPVTPKGYVPVIGTCSVDGKLDAGVVGIRFDTSLYEAKQNPTGRDGDVLAAWRADDKGVFTKLDVKNVTCRSDAEDLG